MNLARRSARRAGPLAFLLQRRIGRISISARWLRSIYLHARRSSKQTSMRSPAHRRPRCFTAETASGAAGFPL